MSEYNMYKIETWVSMKIDYSTPGTYISNPGHHRELMNRYWNDFNAEERKIAEKMLAEARKKNA